MKKLSTLLKTARNWMSGHKLRAAILALVLVNKSAAGDVCVQSTPHDWLL